MKKLLSLTMILACVACSNGVEVAKDPFAVKRVVKEDDRFENNLLLKTSEYIESDSETTLFLFKTPIGAEVEFYMGEKGRKLEKVEEIEFYEGNYISIGGLELGKEYEYKIISEFKGEKLVSDTETYVKEDAFVEGRRAEWARDAIFYEVFIRSFYDSNGDGIGDIDGLREKLVYLKDLGIDALWLMPMSPSPSYHGYDVTDYKGVEEDYGSIEDFKLFLDEAHKMGIRVVIDFVINHSSSEHPWFEESKKGEENPYRDYYVWATEFDELGRSGDWGQQVWHKDTTGTYYGVFWGGMPDLNFRNKVVRDEIKDAAKFWIDLGVDGFRLDASKYIDQDSKVTHLWWQEFNAYVKGLDKDIFLVGENWDTSPNYVAKFMKDMDSSFNFYLSDLILDGAKGLDVDIVKAIEKRDKIYSKYHPEFIDTIFLRNHDMTRLSNELLGDVKKQKLALTMLMTIPATPFIYYGEELGQQGRKPDENLREPMDWYKSANGQGMTSNPNKGVENLYTIANDGISLEEQAGDMDSIYEYLKRLIEFRKVHSYIVDGEYEKVEADYRINAYRIKGNDEEIVVVHNSNSKSAEVEVDNNKYNLGAYESIVIKNEQIILSY